MDDAAQEATLHDILALLFGPSVDYVGAELASLSNERRANMTDICTIALKLLGDRVVVPAEIPPRILGCLVEDGSFCEEHLTKTYWGGIIASSRSACRHDDRGLRRLKLLGRLSTYQIRSHYFFYATLRSIIMGPPAATGVDFDAKRYRMATFVPAVSYLKAMGFDELEVMNMAAIVTDSLAGLGAELLLDGSNTGSEAYLKRFFKHGIAGEGIVYAPSVLGVQLFLWAFGMGDRDLAYMADPAFDCRVEGAPACMEGAVFVHRD